MLQETPTLVNPTPAVVTTPAPEHNPIAMRVCQETGALLASYATQRLINQTLREEHSDLMYANNDYAIPAVVAGCAIGTVSKEIFRKLGVGEYKHIGSAKALLDLSLMVLSAGFAGALYGGLNQCVGRNPEDVTQGELATVEVLGGTAVYWAGKGLAQMCSKTRHTFFQKPAAVVAPNHAYAVLPSEPVATYKV